MGWQPKQGNSGHPCHFCRKDSSKARTLRSLSSFNASGLETPRQAEVIQLLSDAVNRLKQTPAMSKHQVTGTHIRPSLILPSHLTLIRGMGVLSPLSGSLFICRNLPGTCTLATVCHEHRLDEHDVTFGRLSGTCYVGASSMR